MKQRIPLTMKLLNQKLDIENIAEQLGIELVSESDGRMRRAFCPFHAEDTPSFIIYLDTNSWYAFCCSKGGGPVQLIAAVKKISSKKVLEEYGGIIVPLEEVKNALQKGKTTDDIEVIKYRVHSTVREIFKGLGKSIDELEEAHRKVDECKDERELRSLMVV